MPSYKTLLIFCRGKIAAFFVKARHINKGTFVQFRFGFLEIAVCCAVENAGDRFLSVLVVERSLDIAFARFQQGQRLGIDIEQLCRRGGGSVVQREKGMDRCIVHDLPDLSGLGQKLSGKIQTHAVLAALRQNLGDGAFGAEVLRSDLVDEYAELLLAVCLLIVIQRHQQHIDQTRTAIGAYRLGGNDNNILALFDQLAPVFVVCLEVHKKGERIRQLVCQIIRDLFTCQHLIQRCHIHIAFLDHIADGSMNGCLLLAAHIGVVGFHDGLDFSDGIFPIAGVAQFEQVNGDSVLFDAVEGDMLGDIRLKPPSLPFHRSLQTAFPVSPLL